MAAASANAATPHDVRSPTGPESSSSSPPGLLYAGLLLKQGYVVRSWKSRAFALSPDSLAYYAPEDVPEWTAGRTSGGVENGAGDGAARGAPSAEALSRLAHTLTHTRPLGVILLSDVTAVVPLRNRGCFCIRTAANASLGTRARDYVLLASSEGSARKWVEALHAALLAPGRTATLLRRAHEMRASGALCSRGMEVVKACLSSGQDADRVRASAVMRVAEGVPAEERGSDACEGFMLDFRLARTEAELLAVMQGLRECLDTEAASTSVRERLVDTAMAQYTASGEEPSTPRWTEAVQTAFAMVLHTIAVHGSEENVRAGDADGGADAAVETPGAAAARPRQDAAPPDSTPAAALPSVSLDDFREERHFNEDFRLGDRIGEGAYSTVYRAVHIASGEHVAVKVAKKSKLSPVETRRLVDEVCLMAQMDHEHIVRLRAFYEDASAYYIVTELMLGGELFDRIVTRSVYSEREARDIVRVLAEALCYMHNKGIAHRDIKPENILLSSPDDTRAVIKIADLGFAKRVAPTGLSTSCGTPSYVAPDILLGKKYGTEVDMWSLGVITYILLCGYAPFAAPNQTDLFRAIVAGRFYFDSPYWDRVSADAKDLIRHLLVTDSSRRYTAKQALAHRWFQGTVSSVELSSTLLQMRLFQQSRRQVLKRGELVKQGYFVRSMKRRTFVLTSETLEYYDPVDAVGAPTAPASSTPAASTPLPARDDTATPSIDPARMSPLMKPATPPLQSLLASASTPVPGRDGDAPAITLDSSGARPKGIISLKDIRSVQVLDAPSVLGDFASAIGAGLAYMTGTGTVPAAASAVATEASDASGGRRSIVDAAVSKRSSTESAPGEFWFKLVTVSGREYHLCADSEPHRAEWISAINGALETGDLMRKAAMAMQGERLSDAVALMKLATEWQQMMRSSAAGVQAGMTWLPGIDTTDAGMRRSTRIASKVTAAMAVAVGASTPGGTTHAKPTLAHRLSATAAAARPEEP